MGLVVIEQSADEREKKSIYAHTNNCHILHHHCGCGGDSNNWTLHIPTLLTTSQLHVLILFNMLYCTTQEHIQWSAGHSGTVHVNPAPYNFVISQPKWLKFGLQPHFCKMFLHTKFQLSSTCTFRVTKLSVEVFIDFLPPPPKAL